MKKGKILDILIFCNKCFKKKIKNDKKLLISSCMHIFCSECVKDPNNCGICNIKSKYVTLDENIYSRLISNPSDLFENAVDISIFQLNSAISLITELKKEISILKETIKNNRAEIKKLKTNSSEGVFKYSESVPSEDLKKRIRLTCENKSNKSKEKACKNLKLYEIPIVEDTESISILNFSDCAEIVGNRKSKVSKKYK